MYVQGQLESFLGIQVVYWTDKEFQNVNIFLQIKPAHWNLNYMTGVYWHTKQAKWKMRMNTRSCQLKRNVSTSCGRPEWRATKRPSNSSIRLTMRSHQSGINTWGWSRNLWLTAMLWLRREVSFLVFFFKLKGCKVEYRRVASPGRLHPIHVLKNPHNFFSMRHYNWLYTTLDTHSINTYWSMIVQCVGYIVKFLICHVR